MKQTLDSIQRIHTVKLREDSAIFERMLHKQGGSKAVMDSENHVQEVIFEIRGIQERFYLVDCYPLILGRNNYYVREPVDIDFSAYGGIERGVSRNHAQIQMNYDGKVYLIDLESTNGTYIAGNRLTAHKPYLLNNGDHIMLGCLPLVIYLA